MEETEPKTSRRSSLMCGRRSGRRSLCRDNSEIALCESIPVSLPREERLQNLMQSAFEHTIRTFEQEFSDGEVSFSDLLRDGSKVCEETVNELKEENLFKLAVSEAPDERCEDVDCQECKVIEGYKSTITKFQNESEEWRTVFYSQREKLQALQNAPSGPIKHELKEDKYCYASVWNCIKDINTDIELLADELSNTNKTMEYAMKLANAAAEDYRSQISDYLKADALETPRTLIKKMTTQ